MKHRFQKNNHSGHITALALHSAAVIAFQIVLMQLLSVVQWHHFAFMVIAVAMLGFGASGTFISVFRKKIIAGFQLLYPLFMVLSGFLMMTVFPLSRLAVIEFDMFRLFSDDSQIWTLILTYLVYFLPFFLAANAIGLLFIKMPEKIAVLYFSNLSGSGLGGVLVLILSGTFFPEQITLICGMLSVFAGIIAAKPAGRAWIYALSGISVLLAVYFFIFPFALNPSEYKDLAKTLNLPDAEIEYRRADRHGVIHVVSSPALRYAPSLSMAYTETVPVKKSVFVNGNHYGAVPLPQDTHKTHIHEYTTSALPYIMNKRHQVLILNAGTGNRISHALSQSAKLVDASIENAGIIELMQKNYADTSGHLFGHDAVRINHANARIFLSGISHEVYDLIELPTLDAFGGTSGLNSLEENYELTLEAFQLMWDALKPEGVISLSTWTDYPPRTSLKALAALAETARNNVEGKPEKHIVALRSWGTITYVLKKSPISENEIRNIRNFSDSMYFDIALLASQVIDNRMQYNQPEDSSFFDYADALVKGNHPKIIDDYGFDIKASTDDRPHFYQYLRLKNLKHIASVYERNQLAYLDLGYFTVLLTFVLIAAPAVIFIILPLFFLKAKGGNRIRVFLLFSALGIGFMFIEIILIQQFVLYFGYPIYAVTAIIGTMLIAGGMGSLYSSKFKKPERILSLSAFIIVLLLSTYAVFLPKILQSSLGFPFVLKLFFGLILTALPAFFMGIPFPSGISSLSRTSPALIPWAWGINGFFSVISTVLAVFLALELGYTAVMAGAVFCYLIVFGVFASKIFKQKT